MTAETHKAEQAAIVGLAWPQPKRRRGPLSRQRRFEEAICEAIDNGEGIGDINSADVPSWWKPGNPLTKKEEEVVADALASRSGSLVVDDNDDKDDDHGDVAKRKHQPRWKSKSGCASSLNTRRVLAGLGCNVFGMRSGCAPTCSKMCAKTRSATGRGSWTRSGPRLGTRAAGQRRFQLCLCHF